MMLKMPFDVSGIDIDEKKKDSIDFLMRQECVMNVLKQFGLKRLDVEEKWIEFINYHEDVQHCIGCGHVEMCPKVSIGMVKEARFDGDLSFYLTPCKFGKDYFNNMKVLQNIYLRNVQDDILLTKSSDLSVVKNKESNAASIVSLMMKYIENPTNKGFYLHGNPGTGKSTIMGWLIRALVIEGHQCGYIHFPTFLMDLKSSFSDGSSSQSVEMLKNLKFLVIDDVGGEAVSSWSRDELLSGVLSYRSQNRLPTFFTSVYGYNDLKKYYNIKSGDATRVERLVDRMKAVSVEVNLVGPDMR